MKRFSKYIITKIFIHVLVLVGSFILMYTRFGFTSSGDVIKVACNGGDYRYFRKHKRGILKTNK
jgi:hypothetical protein